MKGRNATAYVVMAYAAAMCVVAFPRDSDQWEMLSVEASNAIYVHAILRD
jgi:hypothetical protein